MFVAITLALIVVLLMADREIRAKRPQRHFFKETGEDLKHDKICLWFCALGALGYILTSCANLDASFIAIAATRNYHVITKRTPPLLLILIFSCVSLLLTLSLLHSLLS
jgi:hypothetical protein